MNLCPDCNGQGWYAVTTGNSYNGDQEQVQEQCERCETFGHVFESPEEKALFILLTTDEEREGYFAQENCDKSSPNP